MKAHGFRLAMTSLVVVAAATFHTSIARADFVTFQDGAGGQSAQINSIGFSGGNTVSLGADSATVFWTPTQQQLLFDRHVWRDGTGDGVWREQRRHLN
jgi:hypothetical protein